MTQSFHSELDIGPLQVWVCLARVDPYRIVLLALGRVVPAQPTHVEFLGLPGGQPFLNLFRKALWIAGSAKGFARQDCRCLVVAVSIAARAGETGDQNVGPKSANDSDHVSKRDVVAVPLFHRFVGALGKSKIGDARKALVYAVVAVRSQEFQSAKNAKRVEQAAADLILSAFATGKGHQERMRALASRFESEHAAIFVVGVRRRMHESRGRTEALEGEPKASRADVLWKRLIGRDLERQDGVGPTS